MYKTAIIQEKQKNEKNNKLFNGKGVSINEIQNILKNSIQFNSIQKRHKMVEDDKKQLLYDAMNNSIYPFLNYWEQFGILNKASIYKIIDKISDNVSIEKIDESNNEENEE